LGGDSAEIITTANNQGAIRLKELVKRFPGPADLQPAPKLFPLELFRVQDERPAPNRNQKNGGEYRHRFDVPWIY
jgi:hypothetical protein